MRNSLIIVLLSLLSFGLVVSDASAKRFGGGRSFGMQRSQSSFFSSRPSQPMKSFGQRANPSRWGGMLRGLLIGGLLASLFMGHGLGAGIMSWLVVGVLAFLLVGFLRKRMQPGYQSAASGGFQPNAFTNMRDFGSASASQSQYDYPKGFEKEAFLRGAKVAFIRLQAAYDKNNKEDLRRFTAPEVFAEIEMQINERGNEPNVTEVLHVDAELLDVATQGDSLVASVRFTGSVKENQDPVVALDEIWHFRQFVGDTQWVVGGIQQA